MAWNLEQKRRARGWPQAEMAKQLEPYLGYRMSRAALSKAERSLHGGPIRRFDADEIFALARIFNCHVGDFFGAPEPYLHGKKVLINGKPGNPKARVTSKPLSRSQASELIVMILHAPSSQAERERQEAFTKEILQVVMPPARVDFRRAYTDAIRSYLESHPEALKLLAAAQQLPSEAFEPLEVTLTPAQEQKLGIQIVDASERSRGRKRKRK
ncbi:helix-turn-helix domain-containing protein [Candidatus Binatus sp.]|uniref:helix-turn-helix domain-containing protein n=1 Tax=Candidatus Binatus sp. TaxID=2811406 RepID=UPI003BAF0134